MSTATGSPESPSPPQDFANDIPLELAIRAHRGTSHSPERRGEMERESYAGTLSYDWEALQKLANDKNRDQLEVQFERYRAGYRSRYLAVLAARSRCVSTLIAGSSNFNTRRAEKTNATANKRTTELLEYRTRALHAIHKALCPETAPIMSGDADAVERLQAKLEEAERLQALMVASNKAIRKTPEAERVAALVALGHVPAMARSLLTNDCMGAIGYPDYRIRNNGAEIRRLRKRLEAVTVAKTAPVATTEGNGVRMEDDPAANRVRLFFDGKPNADTRAKLKREGFRWTPTLGCWQAYRTSKEAAQAWVASAGTDAT